MKLIDADALHTSLVKMNDFGELSAKKAIRMVSKATTVDAEPVIRCKDCKYSVDEYDDGECYCEKEKDLRYIKDWDHYCSWAEGKEE